MSDTQPQTSRRLRWWFWLVLFAPVLISVTAPLTTRWLLHQHNALGGLFFVNVMVALPLNFVCSNWAARQIILLRDPRGGSSPWMFLWGPLFFFLNVALAFGGCVAGEQIVRSIR